MRPPIIAQLEVASVSNPQKTIFKTYFPYFTLQICASSVSILIFSSFETVYFLFCTLKYLFSVSIAFLFSFETFLPKFCLKKQYFSVSINLLFYFGTSTHFYGVEEEFDFPHLFNFILKKYKWTHKGSFIDCTFGLLAAHYRLRASLA